MYYESCYWNVRKTCTIYVNMKYYYQPYPRETELLFGINQVVLGELTLGLHKTQAKYCNFCYSKYITCKLSLSGLLPPQSCMALLGYSCLPLTADDFSFPGAF
jgi:hypothetical protein